MSQYRSDSPEEIATIFAQEGENLLRAGFQEPDLTRPPEGWVRLGAGTSKFDTAQEAARLGIDAEVALEG